MYLKRRKTYLTAIVALALLLIGSTTALAQPTEALNNEDPFPFLWATRDQLDKSMIKMSILPTQVPGTYTIILLDQHASVCECGGEWWNPCWAIFMGPAYQESIDPARIRSVLTAWCFMPDARPKGPYQVWFEYQPDTGKLLDDQGNLWHHMHPWPE